MSLEMWTGSQGGLAVDTAGNLYFTADSMLTSIFKRTPSGVTTLFAGSGTATMGFSGDGGPATAARAAMITQMCFDKFGNLYFADCLNHRIRKIAPSGIITTVAGCGPVWSSYGDGGPATNAGLHHPSGVAVDTAGNIYIADSYNNAVRKVNTAGIISLYGGTYGVGPVGDGGPATNAQIYFPNSIAVDRQGNVFVTDQMFNRVRKISPSGIITRFAGDPLSYPPSFGPLGDGGPADEAILDLPNNIAVDTAGNLYIGEEEHGHRIRKVNTSGIITTYAGTGVSGFSGDGGLAVAAEISTPTAMAFDKDGNLYFRDWDNMRIRKITPPLPIDPDDGGGNGGGGDTTTNTTAANSMKKNAVALTVFPNPCKGNFKIRISSTHRQDISISIINIHGREVKREIITTNSLQEIHTTLAPGQYFVKAHIGGQELVRHIKIE